MVWFLGKPEIIRSFGRFWGQSIESPLYPLTHSQLGSKLGISAGLFQPALPEMGEGGIALFPSKGVVVILMSLQMCFLLPSLCPLSLPSPSPPPPPPRPRHTHTHTHFESRWGRLYSLLSFRCFFRLSNSHSRSMSVRNHPIWAIAHIFKIS